MAGMARSVTTPSILSAYRACEDVARRQGRNFHWGFRFLPEEQRLALCALYAFARVTDDIVDEEALPVEKRRVQLEAWDEATRTAIEGGLAEGPVLTALADAARRFEMPLSELLLLIDGCRDDLSVRRYEKYSETIAYCRKVAVTVGLSMLAIFRKSDTSTRAAMTSLGLAFQMTNILRDIPEDLRRDRIYLAQEDLRRHRVTENDLRAGGMTPELRGFMEEMVRRTDALYDAARPLYEMLDPAAARTMRAMARIYRSILRAIEAQECDVWSRSPKVALSKKLAIVAATRLGI